MSVILLFQNLFHKNKHARNISLNSYYLVLYNNPRDESQIANLFRHIYPTRWRFAVEANKDATREPYSYLLVDLRPEQDEVLRLRTNVFPGETHALRVCSGKINERMKRLRRIHRMGEKAIRDYVEKCDRKIIDCVSECAKNVLKGNVPDRKSVV